MMPDLNGWTAKGLDALAEDVKETAVDIKEIKRELGGKASAADMQEVKATLEKMQSDEVVALRDEVRELRNRPQRILLGIGAPILAATIGALVGGAHVF